MRRRSKECVPVMRKEAVPVTNKQMITMRKRVKKIKNNNGRYAVNKERLDKNSNSDDRR